MIHFKRAFKQVLIALILITLALVYSKLAYGHHTEQKTQILATIANIAEKHEVPTLLLKGICQTESDLNPHQIAYKDSDKLGSAVGVCQVLVGTAKWLGYAYDDCKDLSDVSKRSIKYCRLFDVEINATYAAIYLKRQLNRYELNWEKSVAAYNAGSVRMCPDSGQMTTRIYSKIRKKKIIYLKKCDPGGILNSYYVDKVFANIQEIKIYLGEYK